MKALPASLMDCRVDAYIDGTVLIGVWEGQESKKSPQLSKTSKDILFVLSDRNIQLSLFHVKSRDNHWQANGP